MYKFAIVDDNLTKLEYIYNLISQFCTNNNLMIHIDKYCNPKDFPMHYFYDAIFLDIAMPEIDGITLANLISKNYEPLFIFITNKTNLVFRAFSVHPYDFIPKDDLDKLLIPAVKNVIKKLSKTNQKISIKTSTGTKFLSLLDILYFEINNHTLSIATIDELFETRMTLNKVITTINDPYFFLINQSNFINLNAIKSYKFPKITMNNNKILYVSKTYKKGLETRLREFSNTHIQYTH